MQMRAIPSTAEQVPVIGCGTWPTFDVGSSAAQCVPLIEVLRTLVAGGGSVVDTSPMYGRSEGVLGDLVADARATRPVHARPFSAARVQVSAGVPVTS